VLIQICLLGFARFMFLQWTASWRFKVIDFGSIQKHLCDFLLVNKPATLVLFTPFCEDIAGFLLKTATPPQFWLMFGMTSWD